MDDWDTLVLLCCSCSLFFSLNKRKSKTLLSWLGFIIWYWPEHEMKNWSGYWWKLWINFPTRPISQKSLLCECPCGFAYNYHFSPVVLEKTLESPLDCREIQPVHSEGGQPWDFFGRTNAKAETQVLWPPHAKSWLIGKDSDAGRDWGQEEKRMTEDEMAGWHHWLDGRESEWTPGVGDGQGGLACCVSWGRKESDMT